MDNRTESKIAKLQRELELSAFLNKGVLSSNQEQKIRIAELEAENAVLSTCESKLAKLEDAYEEQEKRAAKAETALADAKRRAAASAVAFKAESESRRRAEAEAGRWRGKYERLSAAVAQATSLFEDAENDVPSPSGAERRGVGGFTLALPGPGPATMNRMRNTAPPTSGVTSGMTSSRSSSPFTSARARKRPRLTDDDDESAATTPVPARLVKPLRQPDLKAAALGKVATPTAGGGRAETATGTSTGIGTGAGIGAAKGKEPAGSSWAGMASSSTKPAPKVKPSSVPKPSAPPDRRECRQTGDEDGDHAEDEDFSAPKISPGLPKRPPRKGRHSSPLRNKPRPVAKRPATAPRPRTRNHPDPEAELELEMDLEGMYDEVEVKGERVSEGEGSDSDPLDRWDED